MKTERIITEREHSAMRKIYLIFLMTILLCGLAGLLPVWTQADEGWPQRAGGVGKDTARATAADDSGNIYVVGSFQGYNVVFGNPLPAEASKFTLSSSGSSPTSSGSSDMFVGKIDAGGKWLWVVKGGGAGEDVANAVAVDKDGDVYVTGSFQPPAIFGSTPPIYADPAILNQNTDVFVAKISTNGAWVWVNTAKGEQAQFGTAIAVNKTKEVFVAGTFRLNIAFNVDNKVHELRTLSYAGDKASNDYDVFIAKINAGGEWKWALSGGGTFPGVSCLTGNWCCGSPNAYYQHDHLGFFYPHDVCGGYSRGSIWWLSEDNCRRYYGGGVTYSSSGYDDPPHPSSLSWGDGLSAPGLSAVSPASSAVQDTAAAYLYSGRSGVCTLDAAGTRVSDDRAVGIAVVRDESNTVTAKNIIYVTGYFQGGVNTSTPSQTYDFLVSDDRSAQTGVTCPAGACVTKHLSSSGSGKKDIFVLRFTEIGTSAFGTPPPVNNPKLDWIVDSAHSAGTDEIWPNGIAMDPDLDDVFHNPQTINLYVTGGYKGAPALGAQLRDTGAATHAFVARLSGSGDSSASWGWSRSAGPTDAGVGAEGFSVGADKMSPESRSVYVTGSFQKDLNFYGDAADKTSLALTGYGTEKDLFVTKYNAGSGELQWATKGGLYQTDEPRSIAVDGGGSSFVVGSFGSAALYLSKAATSLISASAMSFNGLDEYVFGPNAVSIDKYAISFWFKTDCINCGILSWSSTPLGLSSDRDIWLINGNLRATVSIETIQTNGTDFADNRWHHVVHTFGKIGSGPLATIGQRLFVDGMERGRGSNSVSTVLSLPGPGINIGYSAKATKPYLLGMISGLKVYDTAMDNTHVNPANPDTPYSLYSDPNNQPDPNSTGKLLFTSGPATAVAPPQDDIFIASLGPEGRWRESQSWIVGQEVPMPEGALKVMPVIDAPKNPLDPTDLMYWNKYFFWSEYEQKLYSIRPTGAVIKWKAQNIYRPDITIVTTGVSKWPDNPQTHIAGVPVDVTPGSPDYTFSRIVYKERASTTVATKTSTDVNTTQITWDEMNVSEPGYTVLLYGVGGLDITKTPVTFKVVKTVYWDEPGYLTDNAACTVGRRITDYSHSDPKGRNGYVYFGRSFHDGYGTKKAYDRETRTGPIIPVNEVSTSYLRDTHVISQGSGHDMVVVWYETDTMKIPWPIRPVRYNCQWPTNPHRIIIASELGSDVLNQPPLDPLVYPEAHVYRQADRVQAGYNPNEEHAALFPSATGNGYDAVFALRDDLYNPGIDLPSKPYVLLKYRNLDDSQWSMLVYKVDRTGAGYTAFNYQGTAGTPIFPPYPIRLLNGCKETSGAGDPYWQDDVNDQYWARSAGTVGVSYYYPLLLGFDYADYSGSVVSNPTNFNGTPGQCVGWLDRTNGVTKGNPISVSYNISWPADVPVLQIGETLLTAKRGLPDITNQAAVQIIYDQLDPDISDPNNALVQLIDPLNPREVQLKDSTGKLLDLPADIITTNDSGKLYFDALPFHLQVRVYYNPLTHKLGFKGYFDGTGMGDPLLLVNVMSSNELDELLALSSNADFKAAVKNLFNLTRNPQKLRLSPPPIIYPSPWGPITWPSFRLSVPHAADLINWETLTAAQKRARLTVVPSLIGLQDENDDGIPERLKAEGGGFALTAGTAAGSGFVTLVFNNDPALGSLPVSMQIIRVECTPSSYQGEIKVIESSNVFDEKLTLRHSGDFGGMPERFQFEWYYHPDQSGLSPVPPPSPETSDLHGWLPFAMSDPEGYGVNDIVIKGASLQTLSDNWYYLRYKGYPVCNNKVVPSPWAGAPGATASNPSAQLAEGWIKRVIRALNPYEARVKDFSAAATNTSLSMLTQLGERYEGVVAMNSDPDNLNSMGLISAYQTVLKRGIDLSIGGTPPINYEAANAALLLAGSRIADFYMLLGNEAYGDAADPTIGFTTTSGAYESQASSIFSFQNQLDSLLEEELVLLRGREYKAARPVYNRLVWNFTSGEGEVAYAQNYGITDQNKDGFIDEKDARMMFPQGHGDAWGHYLTSIKGYYTLLRHPYYSWNPRPEAVLVSGAPVQVDYLDERKFARVAAAKAKTGAEIMNLTYRLKYVDDPSGQWQGYKDTDQTRGWGLAEWGRRVGQGTYFDWVVANSLLHAKDPDPAHTGIQKIDRTTVLELQDIPRQFYTVQEQIDSADAGLNPLGLARNVVPFDIDPSFPTNASGMQGMTHFDQIYERANVALGNALDVFDYANRSTQRLRENQKNMDDFTNSMIDQDYDYKMRLIEVFGYPYSGDLGPTGTYPSDYDGPDLYHYMWMDESELTGVDGWIGKPNDKSVTLQTIGSVSGTYDYPPTVTGNISYVYSEDGGGIIVKPNEKMGVRRAQGEFQKALSEYYREKANYEIAIREYDNGTREIQSKIKELEALSGFQTAVISLKGVKLGVDITADVLKAVFQGLAFGFEAAGECVGDIAEPVADAASTVGAGLTVIVGKVPEAAVKAVSGPTKCGMTTTMKVFEILAAATEAAKSVLDGGFDIAIDGVTVNYELNKAAREVKEALKAEPVLRLQAITQKEVLMQSLQNIKNVRVQGEKLLSELQYIRALAASNTQQYRYQDMSFRIFRNDALQKYRAHFDLAARYVYLAAKAYDYETNLLKTSSGAGQRFLTDIVKQRSLGVFINDKPVAGSPGLSDPLARLNQNFGVLRGQLGFNNPIMETNRFSLRNELFRAVDDAAWQNWLNSFKVDDLWAVPEFRRYARPFVPESAGPQPGLVIPFSSTITYGKNFFGNQLSAGDSFYDPSVFTTKISAAGVWFTNYNTTQLSNTPKVYLIPTGIDVMTSPNSNTLETREWRVVDQKLPVPYQLGATDITNPDWIPVIDSLSDQLGGIRRFSSLRAYHDSGNFDPAETISNTRLVGRSAWNTQWKLIIPSATFLYNPADPYEGVNRFINGVSDIKLYFLTYGYSGN